MAASQTAFDDRLNWLAPAPTYEVWSGVREQPYSITPDFGFLRPAADDPLSPFSFMVQVAIDSPAYFISNEAPGSPRTMWRSRYVDPDPWEFPRTAIALVSAITNGVAQNAERAAIFDHMREFVLLQRFFRAALEGRLGPNFRPEMVRIDDATAASVNRATRTLR